MTPYHYVISMTESAYLHTSRSFKFTSRSENVTLVIKNASISHLLVDLLFGGINLILELSIFMWSDLICGEPCSGYLSQFVFSASI